MMNLNIYFDLMTLSDNKYRGFISKEQKKGDRRRTSGAKVETKEDEKMKKEKEEGKKEEAEGKEEEDDKEE